MSKLIAAIHEYAVAQKHATALASQGIELNYQDLADKVSELSNILSQYSGKCIGIKIENSINWVLLDLACIDAKVITVPLPDFFTVQQQMHALETSGAELLLTDKKEQELKSIFSLNDSSIFLKQLDFEPVKLPEYTAKVTYTSGTTGEPKGVCLSQQGMEKVAGSLVDAIGQDQVEKTAAILPLAVLLENLAGCYATLLGGGCYDICPQSQIGFKQGMIPDFTSLIDYLNKSKAQHCILVPELLRGVMSALVLSGKHLSKIKFIAVGGSRVSVSLLEQAEKMGLPVYEGYGLSEAASVVSVNTPSTHQQGSVGKVLPHSHIDIDHDGEIILKSPALLGYVGVENKPQIFQTGDIGHIDNEGFLYITGRKKNIIINSMGRNISPEWPESELLAKLHIAQAVVLGDAKSELIALIVPTSKDTTLSQIEISVQSANKALPEYAQVKQWRMVHPFTVANHQLTGTGRPKRNVISSVYQQQINTMYSAA